MQETPISCWKLHPLPVLGRSELSYRFTHERQTSLYHCQFWVTLQNGCNHYKQVLCLFNQIRLQFFLPKLKSSGWVDFAVGGKLAFSTTPTYLLQDFLAPFQGHLKLSEVNQNFSIYLRAKRPHFMNWDNEWIHKVQYQFPGTEDPFTKLSDKVHLLRNLHEISYAPGTCPDFLMVRKHDLFAICNHMSSSVVHSYLHQNIPRSKVKTNQQNKATNAQTHTIIT